jgi:peptidoglycan/LPS O-acetylase OafA/YrhL
MGGAVTTALLAPQGQNDLHVPEGEPVPLRSFRPDIQGLRAIAVLLVVLYHAQVPGVRGGYVGVDVFFVISGFLITSQLVRQVETHGRIGLREFYVRRVRRLLPPAALVVLVTLLVSRIWAPLLQTKSLATDAVYTAFYGLNVHLAIEGINYQNENAVPSALQHMWSLAVEEQFYLVWPFCIVLLVIVSRRWWRVTLPLALGCGVVVSLIVSQSLLSNNAPLSYFSIQSRAWEFGVGALVALASGSFARASKRLLNVASVAGLLAILAAGCLYSNSTPFPGTHALLPVLGTAAVIAAGCAGRTRAETVLAMRGMQGLGKVSYPWYLWHWPILVLAPLLAPRFRFTWVINLELMVLALWLAILTYYLLERPLAKARLRKPTWLGVGILTSGITIAVAALVGVSVTSSLEAASRAEASESHLSLTDLSVPGPNAGRVVPSVLTAVNDTPHYPAACLVSFQATTSPECLMTADGSPTSAGVGANRVVLLGDSHAGEWYADVQSVARRQGWDTEVLTKQGCPLATITVVNPTLNRPYVECNEWRSNMIARLRSEPRPRIIFIAALNYYTEKGIGHAWKVSIAALRKIGAPIVYLHDTPYPSVDIPTCVSGALGDWSRCSIERGIAYHPDPLMTGSAASHGLAARVNIDPYLCPTSDIQCPAVRDGVLLYRDSSHVTNTAMTALIPIVQSQLDKAGLVPADKTSKGLTSDERSKPN